MQSAAEWLDWHKREEEERWVVAADPAAWIGALELQQGYWCEELWQWNSLAAPRGATASEPR